jgi:hypothetical protein
MPDGLLYDDKAKAKKWMDERMELFEACKESVLSQEGDFKWVISLDKRTPNRYVQKIVTDERMKVVHCDVRDSLKDVEIDTPWVITSRLDCDDQYKSGFVKQVQRKFRPMLRVIDVGIVQLDWETKEEHFKMVRRKGSMFISLVEPSSRVITAFCRPHGEVESEYPMKGHWSTGWDELTPISKVRIEDRLAVMVCHGNNITNAIVK